jgi:hypothetical protein
MIPKVESERTESEPEGDEREVPAALAEEDEEADPEEAAHEYSRSVSAHCSRWTLPAPENQTTGSC